MIQSGEYIINDYCAITSFKLHWIHITVLIPLQRLIFIGTSVDGFFDELLLLIGTGMFQIFPISFLRDREFFLFFKSLQHGVSRRDAQIGGTKNGKAIT